MTDDDRLAELLDRLEATLQDIRAELRARRAEPAAGEDKVLRAFAEEALRDRDA